MKNKLNLLSKITLMITMIIFSGAPFVHAATQTEETKTANGSANVSQLKSTSAQPAATSVIKPTKPKVRIASPVVAVKQEEPEKKKGWFDWATDKDTDKFQTNKKEEPKDKKSWFDLLGNKSDQKTSVSNKNILGGGGGKTDSSPKALRVPANPNALRPANPNTSRPANPNASRPPANPNSNASRPPANPNSREY